MLHRLHYQYLKRLVKMRNLLLVIIFQLYLTTIYSLKALVNFVYYEVSKEEALTYKHLRDFSFPDNKVVNPNKFPMYLVAKLITQQLNITSVVSLEIRNPEVQKLFSLNHTSLKYPTIIPEMAALTFKDFTAQYQWSRFLSPNKPNFVQTDSREWNFVYCDYPLWKQERVWNLNVFLSVFDNTTWTLFGVSVLIITLTFGRKDFCINLCLVISAIFCEGLSWKPKKSNLCFIWLLFCIIVMKNHYSGTLSSMLVKPVEEVTLGTTSDIFRANYSVLLRNKVDVYYSRELIYKIVASNLQVAPNSSSENQALLGIFTNAVALQDIINKTSHYELAKYLL